jgi:nucleoside-diphosphate-sugar epimerase
MVRLYTSEAGSSSAILRLSNVYGNEEDLLDRVIPRFIMAGLSGDVIDIQGGDQVFDFTHINDTVSGICLAIENLQESSCAHSETYNIVTGKGTTMRYLVDLVEKGLGWEVKKARTNGRNYDVTRFVGDPQKASVSLGFKASILPDDGIPMTIERLRSIEKWNHNA